MHSRIQQELERVCGGAAVSVTDIATDPSAYEPRANRTPILREKLPDRSRSVA